MRRLPRWNTSASLPSPKRTISSMAADGSPSTQTMPSPIATTRPISLTRSCGR